MQSLARLCDLPLVPARGRNTELLNLQGSWELSVTETPRFSA